MFSNLVVTLLARVHHRGSGGREVIAQSQILWGEE
jgi:hypothetical protein